MADRPGANNYIPPPPTSTTTRAPPPADGTMTGPRSSSLLAANTTSIGGLLSSKNRDSRRGRGCLYYTLSPEAPSSVAPSVVALSEQEQTSGDIPLSEQEQERTSWDPLSEQEGTGGGRPFHSDESFDVDHQAGTSSFLFEDPTLPTRRTPPPQHAAAGASSSEGLGPRAVVEHRSDVAGGCPQDVFVPLRQPPAEALLRDKNSGKKHPANSAVFLFVNAPEKSDGTSSRSVSSSTSEGGVDAPSWSSLGRSSEARRENDPVETALSRETTEASPVARNERIRPLPRTAPRSEEEDSGTTTPPFASAAPVIPIEATFEEPIEAPVIPIEAPVLLSSAARTVLAAEDRRTGVSHEDHTRPGAGGLTLDLPSDRIRPLPRGTALPVAPVAHDRYLSCPDPPVLVLSDSADDHDLLDGANSFVSTEDSLSGPDYQNRHETSSTIVVHTPRRPRPFCRSRSTHVPVEDHDEPAVLEQEDEPALPLADDTGTEDDGGTTTNWWSDRWTCCYDFFVGVFVSDRFGAFAHSASVARCMVLWTVCAAILVLILLLTNCLINFAPAPLGSRKKREQENGAKRLDLSPGIKVTLIPDKSPAPRTPDGSVIHREGAVGTATGGAWANPNSTAKSRGQSLLDESPGRRSAEVRSRLFRKMKTSTRAGRGRPHVGGGVVLHRRLLRKFFRRVLVLVLDMVDLVEDTSRRERGGRDTESRERGERILSLRPERGERPCRRLFIHTDSRYWTNLLVDVPRRDGGTGTPRAARKVRSRPVLFRNQQGRTSTRAGRGCGCGRPHVGGVVHRRL